jgi:PAS domain S-box-containing protein
MVSRTSISNPYLLALLAVLVAFGIQTVLGPHFGSVFTFVPFYFGVMLAAWLGGLRPALFAMTLGYALTAYYFITPGSLFVHGKSNLAALAVYLLLSLSTGLLTEFLHKARRHVEETREKLRVTLASIGDAVVATDGMGKIASLNSAAERLTGWQEHEALGRDLEEVFRVQNATTGHPISKTARRILDDGRSVNLEKQIVLISKAGSSIPIEESASPIRDENGEITGLVVIFRDVTEKRQAEEYIRRLAMDAPVGIFQTDARGHCVFVNERWCQITGLSREASLGGGWAASLHPADRNKIFKAWQKTLSAAANFDGEYRFVTPRGEVHWVSGRAVPLRDDSGELSGYLGAVADITDRVLGEKALLESQEQFRAMFELAGIGMVQADPRTGRYLRVNPKFREMTGYSTEDLLQMSFIDLNHPEDKESDLALLQNTILSKISGWSNETRFVRKDGKVIWVHVTGTVSFDADRQPVRTVAHIQDITERKLAEESLRASEQRFRTMADSAPVMIWMSNVEKKCIWFNMPWLDFTGRTMEQELGFGWADGVHHDDLDRCLRLYAEAFGERKSFRLEYRLRRKDNEYRWILEQGIPLYGAGGDFIGYIGSAIDIHEKTEAEEALKEADRRKDEFLAMLAHELRNPLATIQYANYISRLPTIETQDADYSEMIDDQVKHLARLIDDLLDVSRITQDKIALKPLAVDAATIVNRAIVASHPLIEARGHELQVDISDQPMPLLADPTRLEQVVQNLLNNAAKYTPQGGRIAITARPDQAEMVLTVKDNGVGMSRELIPKVFELFTQGDRTLDRSEGGLGIGLTLVRKLVEMHEGTVTARSEGLGRGSEFTVRLPLGAAIGQVPADDNGQQAAISASPLRILVVEDNIDSARTITLILKTAGHHVEMCHNGFDAVIMAKEFDPDVVLLDIGLPVRDGYQVARELRQDERLKHITIIALSGYGQLRDRELSRQAGFDRHLVKPVDFSVLLSLLTRIEPNRPGVSSVSC